MKIIKYILCSYATYDADEQVKTKEILSPITMTWSEANEEIAKREAHNGIYEIIDDGQPSPEEVPTQLDRIEAQVTYTAIITDTLLQEV